MPLEGLADFSTDYVSRIITSGLNNMPSFGDLLNKHSNPLACRTRSYFEPRDRKSESTIVITFLNQ